MVWSVTQASRCSLGRAGCSRRFECATGWKVLMPPKDVVERVVVHREAYANDTAAVDLVHQAAECLIRAWQVNFLTDSIWLRQPPHEES
jgi:hypothetical protein